MNDSTRHALLVGLAAFAGGVAVLALLAWGAAPAGLRAALQSWLAARGVLMVIALVAALAAAGAIAYALLRSRLSFAPRLARSLDLMRTNAPGPQLADDSGAPTELLAAVRRLADDYAEGRSAGEAEVERATRALAEERDLLAAVLTELPAAAIACAEDGRILLYTPRAAELARGAEPDAFLGIGRTIFSLFRRSSIVHALSRLEAAVSAGETRPAALALLSTRSGALLHARFTPLDGLRLKGFFLTLQAGAENGSATSAQQAQQQRQRFANLRAASEALQDFPDMDAAQRRRFLDIVAQESTALARECAPSATAAPDWPLEDTSAETLMRLLQEYLGETLHEGLRVAEDVSDNWLRVESFSLVALLRDYARRLVELGARDFTLSLDPGAVHATLSLRWQPAVLMPPQAFSDWESAPLSGASLPLSPAEILQRHDGELWQQQDGDGAVLRLLLPCAGAPAYGGTAQAPQFDFSGAAPIDAGMPLGARPLRSLSFTVFDTETTGLDPGGGDEIIALGAIRVVNGRIRSSEVLESLVATRRRIDPAAQRVHRIDAQMLEGQPEIGEVLPRLQRFAEDTVLVGHNAAFDERFLEIQGKACGMRIEAPLLDTLLLASLLFEEREELPLERLAQQLGVSVLGRHTALGDAILTAEVFLRLLPLLEARGIRTLDDALHASAGSRYARLQY